MRWLDKRKAAIIAAWRHDRASYAETVRALVDLGYAVEAATRLVEAS